MALNRSAKLYSWRSPSPSPLALPAAGLPLLLLPVLLRRCCSSCDRREARTASQIPAWHSTWAAAGQQAAGSCRHTSPLPTCAARKRRSASSSSWWRLHCRSRTKWRSKRASCIHRSTGASGVADDGWVCCGVQHMYPGKQKGMYQGRQGRREQQNEEQQGQLGQPRVLLACLERLVGVEVEREARVWEKPAQRPWQGKAGQGTAAWRGAEETGIDKACETHNASQKSCTPSLSTAAHRPLPHAPTHQCMRPKLSRSFLQTSRANTLSAPGYCTGSSSTTCDRSRGSSTEKVMSGAWWRNGCAAM